MRVLLAAAILIALARPAAATDVETAMAVKALPAPPQGDDKEPAAVLEIGGAGEWSLSDGGASLGPTVAIEVTPIEHWLEIEAGVTPLLGGGHTEWDTDLLFKKPFTLSDQVEFMVGVGPQWLHRTGGGQSGNSIGGEAALDFMIWPSPERKFGWFVEPTYGYDFDRGHGQSLGISVGLLIAIR